MANIVILGDTFGFPHSQGGASRVRLFVRGLVQSGNHVHIILTRPSEYNGNILNIKFKGSFYGSEYEYTAGTTIVGNNFFKRRILNFKGFIVALYKLFSLKRKKQIDCLILYTREFFTVALFGIFSRLLGVRVFLEVCEWPEKFNETGFNKLIKYHRNFKIYMFSRYAHKFADAFIVISDYLQNKISNLTKNKKPLIKIPILVDLESFECNKSNKNEEIFNIIYSGTPSYKDGIDYLLQSFKLVKLKINNSKLIIIGDTPGRSIIPLLKKKARELGILNDVIFKGSIHFSEIPKNLCEADVLVLERPEGIFSKAGFPTKLGEYLATGIPVVITKTGDIPKYLNDNESAFIVDPGNIKEFANKIMYIYKNPEESRNIAIKGKEVAKNNFDYVKQCAKLSDFINKIII